MLRTLVLSSEKPLPLGMGYVTLGIMEIKAKYGD